MNEAPLIFFGNVMHARLFPKKNKFFYGIYYIVLPLSRLNSIPIAYNCYGFLSFYERDHGGRGEISLECWARNILGEYGLDKADGEITLVCMPRVLGYVFNPVSFWLCHDRKGNLRAVICEVNNTFGEQHCYLCAHPDQHAITEKDIFQGQKLFHVSPFLEREGHYTFRFEARDNRFGVWIDFYDKSGERKLITSLTGQTKIMDKTTLRHAFWAYPLVTVKSIALIHWQALKILAKGIKYIPKPMQNKEKVSAVENLQKFNLAESSEKG